MSSAATGKTEPLQPGGALMLGNEQDCYGGCTDIGQAYNGFMDEVSAVLLCLVARWSPGSWTACRVWQHGTDQLTSACRCASGESSGSKKTSLNGCGGQPGWRTTSACLPDFA